MEGSKIKSFTDLVAWQEAHKLVILVYKATENFPKSEMFGLTSQIRRCAVSISSNIAEGFSRHSNLEKIHFYSISKGSTTELQNQLLIARDIEYLSQEKFAYLADKTIIVLKLTNGLIKSLKNRG